MKKLILPIVLFLGVMASLGFVAATTVTISLVVSGCATNNTAF